MKLRSATRRAAPVAFLVALAVAALTSAFAGAEIVLLDGRVLAGASIERKEDAYHLSDDRGGVLVIPAALVRQMRLTGGDAPPPTGLTFSQPGVLAGLEAEHSGWREMLAAFGKPPVIFRPPSRTERWVPEDGFEGKDATEFRVARWAEAVFDPVWWPRSDYTPETDQTQFRPVRWRSSIVDTSWRPANGFRRTDWFRPSAASPPSEAD